MSNQVTNREEYLQMVKEIKETLKRYAIEQRERKHQLKENQRAGQFYKGPYFDTIARHKAHITDTLNYYLEWRGKDYRHAIDKEGFDTTAYNSTMVELETKYGKPTPKKPETV